MQETKQEQKRQDVAVNWPNLETRKQKLARKEKQREDFYKSTAIQPFVMANLSVNHPDYGMTPAEHLRAKLERQA